MGRYLYARKSGESWQKFSLQIKKGYRLNCNPLLFLVSPTRFELATCGLGRQRGKGKMEKK